MDKEAEKALQDKIIMIGGVPAKPFWNRIHCMYNEYCEHYERKKKENIKKLPF